MRMRSNTSESFTGSCMVAAVAGCRECAEDPSTITDLQRGAWVHAKSPVAVVRLFMVVLLDQHDVRLPQRQCSTACLLHLKLMTLPAVAALMHHPGCYRAAGCGGMHDADHSLPNLRHQAQLLLPLHLLTFALSCWWC